MRKLYFSRTQLLEDIYIQGNKEVVFLSVGQIELNGGKINVLYTDSLEEGETIYDDADFLGEGTFYKDMCLNRNWLLDTIRKNKHNEDIYRKIVQPEFAVPQ